MAAAPVWMVRNKIDLDARTFGGTRAAAGRVGDADFRHFGAAGATGSRELIAALVGICRRLFRVERGRPDQPGAASAIAAAKRRLRCSAAWRVEQGEELVAEELRAAAYRLGRLLGRVDVEDILDVIFREFCIGK